MPDGDKDVKQQGLLLISVGIHNGTDTLEDSLMFCYKIKYTLALQSSSFAPRYLTKGIENLYAHKYLYTDVYSSFIHNCQNLETTKMFFSRYMHN